MIKNPAYRTRHLGEGLVRKYQSHGFNVQGSWDEANEEYSFLFMDRTEFSFAFSKDAFSVKINPTQEYIGRLVEFVEKYVREDREFVKEMQSLANKEQFPKYRERLLLQEVKVNCDRCTLVYRLTEKMPETHDSIDKTIEDYVLRRVFLFTSFKKR